MAFPCPKCSRPFALGHKCMTAATPSAAPIPGRMGGPPGPPGPPPAPGMGGLSTPMSRNLRLQQVPRFAAAGLTPPFQADLLAKLDAAVDVWKKHSGGVAGLVWNTYSEEFYTNDLKRLNPAQLQEIVDSLWREIVDFLPYDTPVSAMVDPGAGNFPSSVSRPNWAAFSEGGLCYRCDTREPGAFAQTGWKPRYVFDKPMALAGTPITACCDGGPNHAAGFWKDNADIVNETTVCVARTLRGVAKFPEPEYTGTATVYAFKLDRGTRGVDTERHQPAARRWLPGEKAFPSIDWSSVVGHVKIMKFGSRDRQGTRELLRYEFLEPKWTFTPAADAATRAYLTAELEAHHKNAQHGLLRIDAADDFFRG